MFTNLIRFFYQNKIRGATRLTLALANKFQSLQSIPVKMSDGSTLYADLRLMSSHGVFLGWTKEIEDANLFRRILSPGDIVFDIGAHIGLYGILFSKIVGAKGKVCAFELSTEALPALERTFDALDNVALFPFGLSNKAEQSFLYIPTDPSAASLANWTDELGPVHKVPCQIKRLDDLVSDGTLPQPDFIKCDVEGAEELVFRGGEQMLNQPNAPIIYFENNTDAIKGFSLEESGAMDFLKGLAAAQYAFYVVKHEQLTRIEKIPPPVAGDLAVNLLAVPQAKVNKIASLLN